MESRKVTRVSPIYHSAVLRAAFIVSVCFVSSQWSRFLLRKKCGCADICFEQTKHSSCLLKLKLIIHECFSRPSLCVLAYKFLELMVNQMVQRLFDPPTRVFCFPVGGWLEQGNAANKCINIRICICASLFLLLKIKYFGLKAFIFLSVLCLQKKKSSFGLLFTVLSSVLFQLKMEDKGQILVLILLLASVFPCDCSFPHTPWEMNKLEANFIYLETIKT